MQSMHQSFLNIQRYRYALYAGLLGAGCVTSYVVDSWRERPAGDTVLGYTLGGIAGALVLFLMSYGIRRRSFHARAGATKRWLSMHVYLGMCVLLVATLHSGLQFGCNVHTLAYGLLCVVVLSGCWGVYAYIRYPTLIARELMLTGLRWMPIAPDWKLNARADRSATKRQGQQARPHFHASE